MVFLLFNGCESKKNVVILGLGDVGVGIVGGRCVVVLLSLYVCFYIVLFIDWCFDLFLGLGLMNVCLLLIVGIIILDLLLVIESVVFWGF